jgi:hypothetical protein
MLDFHGLTPFRSAVWWPPVAAVFLLRGCKLAVTACVATTVVACAPELNWRTVQAEAADGLSGLFPCKPDRLERKVPWPGVSGGVTLHMLSCEAQGHTWALSYATMPDVTLVEPALREWPAMTRANLVRAAATAQGVQAKDLGPVEVPRMTPSSSARAWSFEGPRADASGQVSSHGIQTWHFFHGMTVFQASVSGALAAHDPQTSEDVTQAFFRSFHFPV